LFVRLFNLPKIISVHRFIGALGIIYTTANYFPGKEKRTVVEVISARPIGAIGG
jgi:hypothetical protein